MFKNAIAVVIAMSALFATPALADRLYISTEPETAMFNGQAMWRVAARCAAIEDNIEARFVFERQGTEEYIRRYPDSAWMREKFESERPRMVELSQGRRGRFALFGGLRAGIDRPGAPGPVTFEAEAARQLAEMRARPLATIEEITAIERACGTFWRQVSGDITMRMQRRWEERPGRNG